MAKYGIRDIFGRFAKMSATGEIHQRPPPLRDALGHYVSPPPEIAAPAPPAVDTRSQSERDFDDYVSSLDAWTPDQLGRTLNDYMAPGYDPEMVAIWDVMPTGSMTDGQIYATLDMVTAAIETEEWMDIYYDMEADFWEWFREHYSEN